MLQVSINQLRNALDFGRLHGGVALERRRGMDRLQSDHWQLTLRRDTNFVLCRLLYNLPTVFVDRRLFPVKMAIVLALLDERCLVLGDNGFLISAAHEQIYVDLFDGAGLYLLLRIPQLLL